MEADGLRVHAQASTRARRADEARRGDGFTHGWVFDSHVLWRDPYPRADPHGPGDRADAARDLRHQPRHPRADRSPPPPWPSSNELSSGRMDLGIGRGDSARRVLGKPPTTHEDPRGGDRRHPRPGRGPRGDLRGHRAAADLDGQVAPPGVGRRLRTDGPGHDRARGRRAHPPAGRSRPHPLVRRPAARGRGRGRPLPG